MENITFEERIADLLGYELEKTSDGLWHFTTKKGTPIGEVRYNKQFDVYDTFIDSDKYYVDLRRPSEVENFTIPIKVKERGTIDVLMSDALTRVNISLSNGETIDVSVFDDVKEHPDLNRRGLGLFLSYGLFLRYTYKVGDHDVIGKVKFANLKYDQDHIHKLYSRSTVADAIDAHSEREVRAISYIDNEEELFVSKKFEKFDERKPWECEITTQTVEEFAKEEDVGYGYFKHFKDAFEYMLPSDSFDMIFNRKLVNKYGLEVFCKCNEDEKTK